MTQIPSIPVPWKGVGNRLIIKIIRAVNPRVGWDAVLPFRYATASVVKIIPVFMSCSACNV